MGDILVDTDVFIDHLRGARQLTPGRHRLHYSVITRAELFAGNTAGSLGETCAMLIIAAGVSQAGNYIPDVI